MEPIFLLIEDGIYSFINFRNLFPLTALIPEQSIYICSVSKSLCVGLRIGFMVIPNKFSASIEEGIYNINLVTSPFNAEVICQMIETVLAYKILEERKEMTLERNKIVDEILFNHTVLGNKYYPFRWLMLPEKMYSQLIVESSSFRYNSLKE